MRLVEGIATVDDLDDFVERLGAVGDERGVTVQAFDARYVVDRAHLERAVELADRAIERGENVARDRGVEILLYAAGRRQITRALEMGVSEGERPIVVLVDSPDGDAGAEDEAAATVRETFDIEPAATLGEFDRERVREFFEIGEAELAAADGDLPAIVHERVVLLTVTK